MEDLAVLNIFNQDDWESCRIIPFGTMFELIGVVDREHIQVFDTYLMVNSQDTRICIGYKEIQAIELFNKTSEQIKREFLQKMNPFAEFK